LKHSSPTVPKFKAPKISEKLNPTNFDQILRKKYLHLQYWMN
jgi:hypothetical protein